MYPEHWFVVDGERSTENFGFSMEPPTALDTMKPLYVSFQLAVPVKLDYPNFSIMMDVQFRTMGNTYVVVPLPHNLFCYILFDNSDGYIHMHHCIMDVQRQIVNIPDASYRFPVGNPSRYIPISIVYYNNRIDLYIAGVKIMDEDLVDNNMPTPPPISYLPYDDNLRVRNSGYSVNIRCVKFYNTAISKQQVLEDYYHMYAHYLFDGSGVLGDAYMEECDASGGILYNAIVQGENPLEITSTGNHIREYSVSIPTEGSIQIPTPPKTSFFISFWVYFVDGNSNFELFTKSTLSLSGMTEDTGYSLYYKLSSDGSQTLLSTFSLSTWYMLSIGYDPVDGDGNLHIYVNGEEISSVEITDEAINLIGDGSATIYSFPGVLSDYRQYQHIPSDEEILRLYNGDVAIDDRGTFYASKLTEDSDMETFGFGKGEIRAKSFDFLEESSENSAEFDTTSGVFRIKDFKQV